MSASSFRHRVLRKEFVVGTFLNMGSMISAEICAQAGFDWVVIDLEHGHATDAALLGLLQVLDGYGTPVIARLGRAERFEVGRVLDYGADGVMIPRMTSPEEAVAAVRAARYPPDGDRGVATMTRSVGFGTRPHTVLNELNSEVVVVGQIESKASLKHCDSIAQVNNLDVLFVGASDLSHDLGVPGDFGSVPFRRALHTVLTAAAEYGKTAGIFASSPQQAICYAEEGFTFIAIGSDSGHLMTAAREVVRRVGGLHDF